MSDTASRMRALVDEINRASYRYYVLDEPAMPDKQWDRLYDELKKLEAESGVRLPDSPTRRVGGEPLPAFQQHRHINRLWSLDKVQTPEELSAWFARARALHAKTPGLPPLSFAVEYKYDGLTLNLTYRDGLLEGAVTRGNGVVGEQVLPQARTVRGIPLSIPYRGLMEIHGECFMRLSVLAQHNRVSAEKLKNARNAAAGGLRSLDPAVTAQRRLDARFYEIGTIESPPYTDQEGMNRFITENGIPASPLLFVGSGEDDVAAAIRSVEERRDSLDFLIDGAVIKITDLETRAALGYTDKFPRWAVAWKFAAEEATATLLRVTWEPGRSGRLTPLAHLSPVDFSGVTVQRATLNNYGDILRKDLTLGCTVRLRRSNDVIPEILGRVEDGEAGEPIEKPDVCPACGSALTETGANLFCPNRDGCEPQVIARLTHYCSRDAMNVETLSEKTLETLYARLGVREPQDLYALKKEELVGLPGLQDKKADAILRALDNSRDCQLDAFLYALGIPNVGRATARDLALAFGTLEAVRAAQADALTAIPAVGGVVAGAILEFFADAANAGMVDALLTAGVKPREMRAAAGGALQGRSFVLTGTLPTLTRQQAEDLISRHGGTVSSSVSRRTSYLLLGENPGSKLERARSLGIPALSEEELQKMVGEP